MFPNSNSKAPGSGPDVCQTPAPTSAPVPVPYPNVAQTSNGDGSTGKVLVINKGPVPIKIITL